MGEKQIPKLLYEYKPKDRGWQRRGAVRCKEKFNTRDGVT